MSAPCQRGGGALITFFRRIAKSHLNSNYNIHNRPKYPVAPAESGPAPTPPSWITVGCGVLQVESHERGDPQFFIDEGMVHLAFGYVELVVEGKAGYTELSALPGITPMPADGAESVTTDTALCW